MLYFHDMNFDQMSARFGEAAAYGVLEQIEKAAGLSPRHMTGLTPETRLTNAIRAQDALRDAALPMAA